jgi:SAM-dependent methyltransferase
MPAMEPMSGGAQSHTSTAANTKYFLEHLQEYETSVSQIDTYETIRRLISQRIAGTRELLDVGNGGVFDYDTTVVERITAIDLFLDNLPPDIVGKYFPKNVVPRAGSALGLPEPDGKFDCVLMVMLLHHLTGVTWQDSWTNVEKALAEAWRVLKPGGRLLVVESCIPEWFFTIEKPAFTVISHLIKSVASHPITFQFPVRMIADTMRKMSQSVEVTTIPKGRFVLQFGLKVPSFMTPVQPYAIEAQKRS